ncbi:hypothetical protein ACQ4PT_045191 [Festuca glaucescens]
MEELELPTLDLQHESSTRFTEQLAAACRDHGVPADLTARLFRLTRDLLDTDPGDKAKLPGYFWGTPALSLRVKDLNWVEGLHLAPTTLLPILPTTAAPTRPSGRW